MIKCRKNINKFGYFYYDENKSENKYLPVDKELVMFILSGFMCRTA